MVCHNVNIQQFNSITAYIADHTIRHWAIPEKNPNTTGGAEDMEFPGVLKKKHVEILGVN